MSVADQHPFAQLTPDLIMDAVESQGYLSDGRFIALNSYENRVYQVGIDEATPIIAKFYRPERWSYAQLIEEHQFAAELFDHEIPVVAPATINQQTLHSYNNYYFAFFKLGW